MKAISGFSAAVIHSGLKSGGGGGRGSGNRRFRSDIGKGLNVRALYPYPLSLPILPPGGREHPGSEIMMTS